MRIADCGLRIAKVALLALLVAGVPLAGCKGKVESTPDVVVVEREALPTSPTDPAWLKAPVHVSELLLQDMVDPRLMEPSTQQVRVRAMTDGTTIAFHLSWDDATRDDVPGPGIFPDGCAVQLPRAAEADLPAPQMGEGGRVVEIAYWRASWQAVVDGRGDTIRDLYPTASVDHYPFEAASLDKDAEAKAAMEQRYAPARALGGGMAGPRDSAVQALLAQGPGTLSPDSSMRVGGTGRFADGGWSVVISRPVPEAFRSSAHGQVAFAVWEGSHAEVGARKMRTGWVPLVRRSDG
jgi:DMSO reductase family type II enzyme heme b subunit